MKMITTTLNAIRTHNPCPNGWEKLLKNLGKKKADDEPLPLVRILESVGLDHAIWCFRAVEGHAREIRLFAVACARRVEHLHRDIKPTLDVAERYANGQATTEELRAAEVAAWAAGYAAFPAGPAEGYAAAAAGYAAGPSWEAAWAAAEDASHAAWEALAATAEEAREAEKEFQTKLFIKFFGG